MKSLALAVALALALPGCASSSEPTTSSPAPKAKKTKKGKGPVILQEHNKYRARHCAPPLTWSPELAKVAQKWADTLKKKGCAFEHSRTRYGENLAAGTTGAMPPERVVAMWYEEIDKYSFKKPRFSMETGHFTQLVWKGTTKLGCAMTQCNGFDVWVCNYDPPGNVERGYKANVLPKSCR